jgi:hypothetical protein
MRMMKLFAIGLAVLGLWTACGKKQAETAQPEPAMATAIDWTQHGFPTVLDSVIVPANQVDTISAGIYTVQILDGTFNDPVKFEVLAGDTASFKMKTPEGEVPVLAFALRVTDTVTHQPVVKFNKPVTLIATTPSISEQSKYYSVNESGDFTLNAVGMQVSSGQLEHPIMGTDMGWVITTPVSRVE